NVNICPQIQRNNSSTNVELVNKLIISTQTMPKYQFLDQALNHFLEKELLMFGSIFTELHP
ncbi:MAG TPA: hypothetical protein PLH86_12140, partial [Saprospiraceae bacterium]|nr:hypothetical protein [Saprospiraceae bacterium]